MRRDLLVAVVGAARVVALVRRCRPGRQHEGRKAAEHKHGNPSLQSHTSTFRCAQPPKRSPARVVVCLAATSRCAPRHPHPHHPRGSGLTCDALPTQTCRAVPLNAHRMSALRTCHQHDRRDRRSERGAAVLRLRLRAAARMRRPRRKSITSRSRPRTCARSPHGSRLPA